MRTIYTATSSASAIRPELCDHCGCAYIYELQRTASAQAETGLLTDGEEARETAQEFATQALEARLTTEFDAVACPKCGHFGEHMVEKLRRERLGWIRYVGPGLLAFGALVWLMMRLRPGALLRPTVGGWMLAGAVLLGIRWLALRGFDPNRDAAARAAQPSRALEIPKQEYRERMALLMRGLAG